MDPFIQTIGKNENPVFIWAHGWGQDHKAFLPLAESLQHLGEHILLDLPGFGQSAAPEKDWGTGDYADFLAQWMEEQGHTDIIWIGHSFGGRIGVQIAARHPDLVHRMILVAGAGLKRKRPLHQKIYLKTKIYTYKLLKKLIPLGLREEWLQSRFGSADYKNAGRMRGTFLKTVNEDLTKTAKYVGCPVALIYGEKDTETPPEFGHRFAKLIPNAELFILDGQDHYSILSTGRHQLAGIIQNFVTGSDK